MRATSYQARRTRGIAAGLITTVVIAMSIFGGGSALAADSRIFSVNMLEPSKASVGGATAFGVTVDSQDGQTIANVHLSIPSIPTLAFPNPRPWPSGLTITAVFGADAGHCAFTPSSVSCDLGNIPGFGHKTITVLASVASTVPNNTIISSASAETNNENGSNLQVVTDQAGGTLQVVPFDPNQLFTANQTGSAFTALLGTTGAGNLQTKVNLLQDNGGKGNVITITEGTNTTQPTYCVKLKLNCQLDFTDVTVNSGATVTPYLETILTANVPSSYNIRKAFIIHVLPGNIVDTGFPLYNPLYTTSDTSCLAHPTLVPCADFSLSKSNVLTITVHTTGNSKYQY